MNSVNSKIQVVGNEEYFPGTKTETLMLKNTGVVVEEVGTVRDIALVYLTKNALDIVQKTGEFILRPICSSNAECWDNRSILKESRLCTIHFFTDGRIYLLLRESLNDQIKTIPNLEFKAIKLQNSGDRGISLDVLGGIDKVTMMAEHTYLSYAKVYVDYLSSVYDNNQQQNSAQQTNPQTASAKKNDSSCSIM